MSNWALGWRLARRELRGGVRGLRIVLACLALGVAAIAAVGTLQSAVEAGLEADGARLMGGDVVAAASRPFPPEARAWIESQGGRATDVVRMRAMAVAPSGERTLVELKAADSAYPLYGEVILDPPGPMGQGAGGLPPVAMDPIVAERLNLSPGAVVRIGEGQFTYRGALVEEPDKAAGPAVFGPRALVPLAALEATGLIQPGSLVTYELRAALPPGADATAFASALRNQPFADGGWRVRDASQGQPGVNRFLDQAASFLVLAGLTALLVGGIGVATGVRSWLEQRGRTIATLRCLGAPAGAIFATYLIQVLALALLGIAIGLVAGYGLTWAAAAALADALPVPPRLGFYPLPLALAAAYGLLTALAFALWPLGRARDIPGAALFRDNVQPQAGARPRIGLLAANALVVALLVSLVVATAEQPAFALAFCVAALGTLALFRLAAAGLQAVARRIPAQRRPSLRLGLANLHRPGAPTALMLVSLGIGLTTLAAIALIQGNLRQQISESLPEAAPSFYFIDIQSDQVAEFDRLAQGVSGVTEVKRVPSLRARIAAVNGVPADQVQATEETRWALRGDRGLTYAATPPEGTKIIQGSWWAPDYRGEPLVSLDDRLARGWNAGPGSIITVNVLGRDIDLRVASTRDIEWRGLGINFTMIASPGMLEAAPHTHIATVRGDPAQDATLLRVVTDAFPNVTGIRVRDALDAFGALLGRVGTALSSTGALTLASGLLVLAGAVAAGQRRRIRDAVVLKTLGATRSQIRRAWLVEFGLLGLVAGLVAAAVGTAASWGVTRFVMRADWTFLPGTLAATIILCVVLTLAMGYAGTALALRAKAAPLLRNE
ncbi:ABC transporter permease [Roseomonas xinghualingensis]|uniref:ABC transporter permease n=1 Tax=Roseomonas xinghualingensis TaxID=2986475 RepID=UPI0021F0A958|nr:FtsX-like permease family protein [Roseomonas sp. SXEYE001]MCV4207631.1 FtsX-like permease family protein [Roseomonas sp. SXEYE001]